MGDVGILAALRDLMLAALASSPFFTVVRVDVGRPAARQLVVTSSVKLPDGAEFAPTITLRP